MSNETTETYLLELIDKIQQTLSTTTPWVLFRIYEDPDGKVHWTILIGGDKTVSITLTKERPPLIRETIFEGSAEEFVSKALEVIPLKALEHLPTQMEFWLSNRR